MKKALFSARNIHLFQLLIICSKLKAPTGFIICWFTYLGSMYNPSYSLESPTAVLTTALVLSVYAVNLLASASMEIQCSNCCAVSAPDPGPFSLYQFTSLGIFVCTTLLTFI
uniref:Uncharacterized protein n=1 Tax=Arundo donax TaxID=35708 RepID=A0A0A9CV06_ARUDO